MTLLENVVMAVVLTIAALMFYNTVIFINNVKADIYSINDLKQVSKILDKEILDLYNSDADNFESNLDTYIAQAENGQNVDIDYAIKDNGVYIKIFKANSGLEFNMFRTLSRAAYE